MTRARIYLLEVLVATAIMAIAVTTAVTALRTSLRNADRQWNSTGGRLARRKMDELLAERLEPALPRLWRRFPAGLRAASKRDGTPW